MVVALIRVSLGLPLGQNMVETIFQRCYPSFSNMAQNRSFYVLLKKILKNPGFFSPNLWRKIYMELEVYLSWNDMPNVFNFYWIDLYSQDLGVIQNIEKEAYCPAKIKLFVGIFTGKWWKCYWQITVVSCLTYLNTNVIEQRQQNLQYFVYVSYLSSDFKEK